MTPEARAMLDQIDEFLIQGNDASRELAAVLTALRGPDYGGSGQLKEDITIPIRKAAFPKSAQRQYDYDDAVMVGSYYSRWGSRFMSMGRPNQPAIVMEVQSVTSYSDHYHFIQHGMLAAEALDILVNPNTTTDKLATDKKGD